MIDYAKVAQQIDTIDTIRSPFVIDEKSPSVREMLIRRKGQIEVLLAIITKEKPDNYFRSRCKDILHEIDSRLSELKNDT